MILDSLTAAASENLKYTYFELGRAANSKVLREPGFAACVGDFEHPICNFALGLDLDQFSANRLAQVAIDRPSFNVYATPLDQPANLGELLTSEGFHRSYRLVQMVAEPQPLETKNTLTRASTRHDRLQIAYFMVDQFFTKQGQPFRDRVAHATARATSLELLALKREGRILAATMVCFNEGMAGVYNVCVETSLRGLGVGSAMLREILAVSAMRQAPATLQCDSKLEGWYANLGFRRTGEVDVYALAKPNALGILQ